MKHRRNVNEIHFCGCCGNSTDGAIFCTDCISHLDPDKSKAPHDRTWFAQYGTDCPNDVGGFSVATCCMHALGRPTGDCSTCAAGIAMKQGA